MTEGDLTSFCHSSWVVFLFVWATSKQSFFVTVAFALVLPSSSSSLSSLSIFLQPASISCFLHMPTVLLHLLIFLRPPFHPTRPLFILSKQNSGISPKCHSILIALSVCYLFLWHGRNAGVTFWILIFEIFDEKTEVWQHLENVKQPKTLETRTCAKLTH